MWFVFAIVVFHSILVVCCFHWFFPTSCFLSVHQRSVWGKTAFIFSSVQLGVVWPFGIYVRLLASIVTLHPTVIGCPLVSAEPVLNLLYA